MYRTQDYYGEPDEPSAPNNRCDTCGAFLRHQPDPGPAARYWRIVWARCEDGLEHVAGHVPVTDPAEIAARRYDEAECAPPVWTCRRCGSKHDSRHVWPD